jgi:hypothetical protein
MKNFPSPLSVFLILPCLLLLVGITFHAPDLAQAGPLAGFTPTPIPPPPPDDGGDNGDTPPSDQEKGGPKDSPAETTIQIESCQLEAGLAGSTTGAPLPALASIDLNGLNLAGLGQDRSNQTLVEVMIEVNLVHQGSGFILSGSLSDQHPRRFSMPYPGWWDVLMTTPPRLISDSAVDEATLNLNQLQARLAEAPLLLGAIQADAATPQLVPCPVQADPNPVPAEAQSPATLPTTGAASMSLAMAWLIGGLSMAIVGVTFLLVLRSRPKS